MAPDREVVGAAWVIVRMWRGVVRCCTGVLSPVSCGTHLITDRRGCSHGYASIYLVLLRLA